jgi:uncharacterized membrane protein YgdD (TMEM256/DUF423 family)
MTEKAKQIAVIGSAMLALSIALGAFAAHGLKDSLSVKYLEVFETGVQYQTYGSMGLILLALAGDNFRKPALLLLCGMLVFSFSLYLLSMNELWGSGLKKLGAITPIGGVLMISAWVWSAFIFKKKNG